jgi:hypothetical protein
MLELTLRGARHNKGVPWTVLRLIVTDLHAHVHDFTNAVWPVCRRVILAVGGLGTPDRSMGGWFVVALAAHWEVGMACGRVDDFRADHAKK